MANSNGFHDSSILIVDDNKDNLSLITDYMADQGYDIMMPESEL